MIYLLSATLQVLGADIAVEPRRETVGLRGGLSFDLVEWGRLCKRTTILFGECAHIPV